MGVCVCVCVCVHVRVTIRLLLAGWFSAINGSADGLQLPFSGGD